MQVIFIPFLQMDLGAHAVANDRKPNMTNSREMKYIVLHKTQQFWVGQVSGSVGFRAQNLVSLFLGSVFSALAPFSHGISLSGHRWLPNMAPSQLGGVRVSFFESPSSLPSSEWAMHPSLGDSQWPRCISVLNCLGSASRLQSGFILFQTTWSTFPLAYCIYGITPFF